MLSENAQRQGSLWGWRARDWAECLEPTLLPLYQLVLAAVQVTQGTELLDAGCGTGGASSIALERGAKVTGFDAAEGFLTYARLRLPQATFHLGDLQAIPFDDQSFDTAIAVNSVQFTARPVDALRELRRVTRGKIGIVNWARPDDCDMRFCSEAIARLLPEPPTSRGPVELAGPGVLDGLLREAGLAVEHSTEVELTQTFPDLPTALRGLMSTGPNHRAVDIAGEAAVQAATTDFLERFRHASTGAVQLKNYFRVVVAAARP